MRYRLGGTALIAVTTAVATVALAQSRASSPPAAAAASADPPPVNASPVASGPVADGGVRWSPLNPQPDEKPTIRPPAPTLDYDALLAEVAALRARVAVAGDNLFVARVGISLEIDQSHARIDRLVLSLDDGVVFVAPGRFSADDATSVYDHAVAPGKHAVTIDIDRHDDRDEAFRSSQRSRFMVDVPKDQRVDLQVRVDDDSNMGGNFPSNGSGTYDLRVRAKARARAVAK